MVKSHNSTYRLMRNILQVRYTSLKEEQLLCESLLRVSVKENYDYGIAFAHTYLGDAYMGLDQVAQAMEELDLARTYSERHGFQDLLLKAHRFTGTCFLMMHDEHSAIEHFLIGLDLAPILDDILDESIILNNIASIFDKRQNIADAAYYYHAAYRLLDKNMIAENPSYSSILLFNLVNTSCGLGRLEEAKSYLMELKNLNYNGTIKQITFASGWHIFAITTNNKELALEMTRQILLIKPESISDKFFTFEILIPTFEGILELGIEEYSRKILELLDKLCGQSEPEHMKTLMKLRIQYCQRFASKDELFLAYQNFIEITNDNDQLNDQLIADGIKARMHLSRVTKEKEVVQQQNRDLERAANIDETTRLYNRRYFNQMISRLRTGELRKKAGFVIVDVDYFKEYNDFYGHIQGDEILKTIANCLMACANTNIYPCRHGGDEFACLCLDMEDSQIELYIRQVQQMLDHYHIPHENSPCSDRVTVSAGFCNKCYTRDTDVYGILDAADQALYQAKSQGRNRFSRQNKE